MKGLRAADTKFASLKDFQRRTVDYVLHRLYDDPEYTDRFLVADEVGMGKTLVARGVIAGAIERLEKSDSVSRIDVVYICSNADIARQNLAKLDVRGDASKPLNTRITMLASQVRDLDRAPLDHNKTVNLISFTPGTSFGRGHQGGMVRERALLHWMIEPLFAERSRAERNALSRVLRLRVSRRNWDNELRAIAQPGSLPDAAISGAFRSTLVRSAPLTRLEALVLDAIGRSELSADQSRRANRVVSDLRSILASVSVKALEPDLVILDEFQRFKHLLEHPDTGTAEEEVSGLAQQLFGYPDVKVLLLSATPYKLFTFAEERSATGEDHYADLMATLDFLLRYDADRLNEIRASFRSFRQALITGAGSKGESRALEELLLRVICRTERPTLGDYGMLSEKPSVLDPPMPDELVGYVAMRKLAKHARAPLSIDYWKSAPYFLNFMDGYKLHGAVRELIAADGSNTIDKSATPLIRPSAADRRQRIDPGNARLRALAAETVEAGLWRLLWLPPSMPYHELGGVFGEVDPNTVTKRLIFSSWAAAPTGIASLLSHEALRLMLGEIRRGQPDRGKTSQRLGYPLRDGQPDRMTTLALFVPSPGLADLTDPLELARQRPDQPPMTIDEVLAAMTARVELAIPPAGRADPKLSPDSWYWAAPLRLTDGMPPFSELAAVLSADDGDRVDQTGLAAHLDRADSVNREPLGSWPPELATWVAKLGVAGPANVAWRALRRVTAGAPEISADALWRAAAVIASGFRALFNRPEVMALLDGQGDVDETRYWQRVLDYCCNGGLQAVMDEYLHHLVGNLSPESDEELEEIAEQVRKVVALRIAPLRAFDPLKPRDPIVFNTRFALRYGSARGTVKTDDKSVERTADVQAAFNSPFWPMVLASTSVGQEGVDFHWWCHSLVHWNVPANPVDFEQREGRVHRFKGHAVRKNIAAAHRADALRSVATDPWEVAFEAAHAARTNDCRKELGDLWPWWVFPGPAKIERWTPSLPFSRDIEREKRLRRLRGLYRLAFGQPRQEELLELLASTQSEAVARTASHLDLRPPFTT